MKIEKKEVVGVGLNCEWFLSPIRLVTGPTQKCRISEIPTERRQREVLAMNRENIY